MLLYSIIIVISYILIVFFNILFGNYGLPHWQALLFTVLYIIFAILIDALVAIIGRRCISEKRITNMKCPWFSLSRKREVFYVKYLRLRKWKDIVPELGGFTSFSKSTLSKPNDNKYIEKFILESKYGIVIHYISFFASFLIILFDWHLFTGTNVHYWLSIGLPVAIINAILILLPGLVLRYNLKKLYIIYDFNKSKIDHNA